MWFSTKGHCQGRLLRFVRNMGGHNSKSRLQPNESKTIQLSREPWDLAQADVTIFATKNDLRWGGRFAVS